MKEAEIVRLTATVDALSAALARATTQIAQVSGALDALVEALERSERIIKSLRLHGAVKA